MSAEAVTYDAARSRANERATEWAKGLEGLQGAEVLVELMAVLCEVADRFPAGSNGRRIIVEVLEQYAESVGRVQLMGRVQAQLELMGIKL